MRRGVNLLLVCSIIVLLSISLASASWWSDFWNNFFGKPQLSPSLKNCVDSDGINENISGAVTYTTDNGNKQYYNDSCYSSTKVKEWYCNINLNYVNKIIICPTSCVKGACVCSANWVYGTWSSCVNNQQTRTATDSNNCGNPTNKPVISQNCTCTENWQCENWSSCINSQQTRTCTDSNNCGTSKNKPVTSQNCTMPAIKCYKDSDCGNSTSTKYCLNESNLCTNTTSYSCNNPGTTSSYCSKPVVNICGPCDFAAKCSNGVCASCVPETNTAFCTRWQKTCGNFTGTDNCQVMRTVNCGTCTSPLFCNSKGFCVSCTESWSCGNWSSCVNNTQTRTCSDSNKCGTIANRPAEIQSCVSEAYGCTDQGGGYCINITAPKGGDVFKIGDSMLIQWNQKNIDRITIGYSLGVGTLDWILYNQNINSSLKNSSYVWNIPKSLTIKDAKNVTIQITGYKTNYGGQTSISGMFDILVDTSNQTLPSNVTNLTQLSPEPTVEKCSWWCKFWKSILG